MLMAVRPYTCMHIYRLHLWYMLSVLFVLVGAGYADNHARSPRNVSIGSNLYRHIVSLAHQCGKQTVMELLTGYCTCICAYRKYE
jgi:hypothetical protein